MKTNIKIQNSVKAFFMLLVTLFSSALAFAQDVPEKVDVDITADGGSTWYGQPWVWAIGVAIFILVLVIVTRNNKSAEA